MKLYASPIGEVYLLNAKNQAVLEGKSRHAKNAAGAYTGCLVLFMVVWLVGWLGGSAAFAHWAWQSYQRIEDNKILNVEGHITEGIVTKKRISRGDSADSYYISYRFFLNNRAYTAEDEVSYSTYKNAEPEKQILIRYMPGNPNISRYVSKASDPLSTTHKRTDYMMAFCFNLAGISILVGGVRVTYNRIMRADKLYREAYPLPGKIMRLEPQKDSDGDPAGIRIHYRIEGLPVMGHYDVAQGYPHLKELAKDMPLAIWYADEKTNQPL